MIQMVQGVGERKRITKVASRQPVEVLPPAANSSFDFLPGVGCWPLHWVLSFVSAWLRRLLKAEGVMEIVSHSRVVQFETLLWKQVVWNDSGRFGQPKR